MSQILEPKFVTRLAAAGIVNASDWLALKPKARKSIFGITPAMVDQIGAAIAEVAR
ncbi:MAG: hypothetical protein JSR66_03100 [Proteobacteria bacterium]|nr:hypothetical protein [Pseudomonadota bacterium]